MSASAVDDFVLSIDDTLQLVGVVFFRAVISRLPLTVVDNRVERNGDWVVVGRTSDVTGEPVLAATVFVVVAKYCCQHSDEREDARVFSSVAYTVCLL